MISTLAGRLLMGLVFEGRLYFDVKVRLMTLADECCALALIEEDGIKLDSEKHEDRMLVDLAYLSQQFELEGVPKEALTPRYLFEHLATDDYNLLMKLVAELRKKRIACGDSPSTEATS